MANNFRVTGEYYVSKAGNDSNDGLTPDTPKLTVQAGINLALNHNDNKIIIGTGVYKEAINVSNQIFTLVGDGLVILQGNGSNSFDLGIYSSRTTLSNITLTGYGQIQFSNSQPALVLTNNSLIRNVPIKGIGGTLQLYSGSKLINVDASLATFTAGGRLENATLINCVVPTLLICKNTYINQASTIAFLKEVVPAGFNYNCIRGNIIMNTGSNTENDGRSLNLALHKAAYPTFNTRSFSADPKFRNVHKQDFSLAIDSPLLNTADNAVGNIGDNYFGQSYYNDSTQLKESGGAIWTNLIQELGDIKVGGGGSSGTLLTAPLVVASYMAEVEKINYIGALNFNKSVAAGQLENSQVPDQTVYANTDVSGGGNPDRLTFEARWSSKQDAPTVDADWDNQFYIAAGSFARFEWNQKPMLDGAGVGNGAIEYNISTSAPIAARWIQIRITLRNDYQA